MQHHTDYSLKDQFFRRPVRLASASLLLLLTTHTNTFANSLTPFVNISSNYHSAVPVPEPVASPEESTHTIEGHKATDWNGILRDTGIIFGGQIAAVGITYVLPQSFSSWSPEQKKNGYKKYSDNFVNPVLDKDKLYVNYALHPYWGATYYTRARERGLDQKSSLFYSTIMSAMYEFGIECLAEKPSIQDLIVTPVAGSLLGAYIFEPLRESIKSKRELRWYDHAVLTLTDPLGVVSLGFEKLFGIKSTIMVNYPAPLIQNRSVATVAASKSNQFGVTMQFSLQ